MTNQTINDEVKEIENQIKQFQKMKIGILANYGNHVIKRTLENFSLDTKIA